MVDAPLNDGIEFHRSTGEITDAGRKAKLIGGEICIFYQLWQRRGEWLTTEDLMVDIDGNKISVVDPNDTIKGYMHSIRKKIANAGIDLHIVRQRQTIWMMGKWKLMK